MRVVKILVRVALYTGAGVVAFVGLLVALLWVDRMRETTLPTPTGSFAVGRTISVWSNPSRPDPMATLPGAKQKLLAWIWYPAAPPPSQQVDDYMPAPLRKAMENGLFIALLNRDSSRIHSHSLRDAPVSPAQRQYPVIIMRAGLAALTTDYTSLAEDLASHGYVVVGFDAPYRSFAVVFPDGQVIRRAPQNNLDLLGGDSQAHMAVKLTRAWSADTAFALDQIALLDASDPSGRFTGRLDMQHVGVFGHSLGGAAALEFCHDDPRCKAGIDVDGLPLGDVINDGVTQPFLFLLSDHSSEPGTESNPVMINFRSIYNRLPSDRRLWITIRGADHYGFSDDTKNQVVMYILRTLGHRMTGLRQIAISEHFIDTFFDVYLKGAPISELQNASPYPEVEYVT